MAEPLPLLSPATHRRVGILGFGAMGTAVLDALCKENGPERPTVVLVKAGSASEISRRVPKGIAVATTWDEVLLARPDVIIECAGHSALRQYGTRALRSGIDLVPASIGALADRELEEELSAASRTGGRLMIPAGAVAGLDALAAARRAGLDRVAYTCRKAPGAWRGTPAETLIDLDQITEPIVFFEGYARAAALTFPQNANVAAAVALAGLGFDQTEVRLVADPSATGNSHLVEATGRFGAIHCSVLSKTFPDNPKTSILSAFSLVRAAVNIGGQVVI